ncbi:helix-turn-helix domain-containing protein [Brevundimonas denitrificans]|uniref:helix-turn-helix domain-containing protein n=1 Tax=Brevundimonas denitrificans TaxID=1443434 RepID=UPI00223AFC01|nr:helix-turn-helix transcriptional regulator [Brevundimonas denitrificans]
MAGEQLRLARLAHGYSLEEVGELIGATRQFIHQLETGSRSPSDEVVDALADVLGVTPAFLAQPIPSTVRPEQCHFRGHITRPASITSQVLARGTLLDNSSRPSKSTWNCRPCPSPICRRPRPRRSNRRPKRPGDIGDSERRVRSQA